MPSLRDLVFGFQPSEVPPVMRGQIPVNEMGWAALLQQAPTSQNVEDRRYVTSPLNPFTNAATSFVPGRGYVHDPLTLEILRLMQQRMTAEAK